MKTVHKTLVAFAFVLVALPSVAQENQLFPTFSIAAGGYGGEFDTSLRLDPQDSAGSGTDVEFEEQFGLETDNWLPRVAVQWRPFNRHEFSARYFATRRDVATVLNQDVQFGDVLFPANSPVTGNFDVDFWDIGYTYWMVRSETTGLGIDAGAVGMSVDTALQVRDAKNVTLREESASATLPIPVIGLSFRKALTDRLLFRARASALPEITWRDYSSQVINGAASLEYHLTKNIALGGNYNFFEIDASADSADFDGELQFTVQGPEAFVRIAF